jgi:septin family protein
MASLLSFDPLIIIPFLGGIIGMSVGLVTIWNSFKNNQQKQKTETQAAAAASENRLKEYFDLRIRIVDTEVEALKRDLHTMDDNYTRKLEDRSRFFTEWVTRLEEKIKNGKP